MRPTPIYILFLLVVCLYTTPGIAQTSYEQIIRDAEQAKNEGHYRMAIQKYNAAKRKDPTRVAEIDAYILAVFDEVNNLKIQAETAEEKAKSQALVAQRARKATENALKEVQKQKNTADSLLTIATTEQEKNRRIIDALYFYDGKYALAAKRSGTRNRYGFIDKDGNTRIDFLYDEARPFESTGFARVKKKEAIYFIDTTGREYLLAESLEQLTAETEALDLRSKQLTIFPDTILSFPRLKIVLLNNNEISQIPSGIANLKNLTALNLSYNQLTQLPNDFGQLQNLNILILFFNQLTQLPDNFSQLQNLTALFLSMNQLTQLPNNFSQLQNLTALDLPDNQLTQLPNNFSQLQNLTYLNLSYNQLTQLPNDFGQLQNLTELDLGSNQLTHLPESFGKLQKLTVLELFFNQFTQLPEGFGKLQNLKDLRLSDNQLTHLPESFGKLQNLTVLDLSINQLTQLPESFGELQKLNWLNLQSNHLAQLPEGFGKLQNLMEINLYNNQLTQLPESLSQLYNLTTLDLSGNQLTQLPDNLETVTSITILRALWNVWQEKTDSVTVDSLRLLHADMARLNERLVQLLEQNGSDSDAADLCSLLARSYLISEQYQQAESALEKGEALEVENSYLKAIRPHLLLFQGQYEAAQEKYLALKNEPFDPNSIYATFKEAFLADFADFEKMGVLPEHCKAQVEEIKRLLNEE